MRQKIKIGEEMINMAGIIGFIGFLINAPYLYTAGAGMAHQLGKILWIIPVNEATVVAVPYGTIQLMEIGISLLVIAGILGIISVFAVIFEGLKKASTKPSGNTQLQKRRPSSFM